MERSEPSLIPQWLKGASSGSPQISAQPAFFQDGSNIALSKSRTIQQVSGSYLDSDSPGGSISSDPSLFHLGRCSHSSSALEKFTVDREIHMQGKLHPSFAHSGSCKRNYAILSREKGWDVHHADPASDKDGPHDAERSIWPTELDILVAASDERKSEKDDIENGKVWLSIPGKPGSYDSDVKLWRLQSMGLSPRRPDISAREVECVTSSSPMTSASGGLATNMQKVVFEHNFPSLGLDDKVGGGLVASPGSGPIASPRPLWQSLSRSDLGRALSPGLPGGSGGPSVIPLSVNGAHGGGKFWNSALAEAPISNDNLQNISLGNASSGSMVLNMAEALSQAPARVRTPPQSAAESQRLEEFALKQSRQLIPVTPSLPKAMSLNDKSKSKAIRAVDGPGSSTKSNQLPNSLHFNSFSRSSSTPRPDTPKHSQGKLLVLKASRDGGLLSTTALKSDGSSPTPLGSSSGIATTLSATGLSIPSHAGVIGQSRRSVDRKGALQLGTGGLDAMAGPHTKDLIEDKRPSTQAQNRNDFFNTLRKKTSGNGSGSILKFESIEVESLILASTEGAMPEKSGISDRNSELELSPAANCIPQMHENGGNEGTVCSQRGESMLLQSLSTENNTSAIFCTNERLNADSEEEEAAFMRSLGWEENAEGSELTEEEISAFYQMRERRKLLNGQNHRYGWQ